MEQMFKELVDFLHDPSRYQSIGADHMDQRFDQMDQRFDRLESQVQNNTAAIEALQGQTTENTDMIKALVHRVDELDAKFDGLLVNTASKESVENIKKYLRAVE